MAHIRHLALIGLLAASGAVCAQSNNFGKEQPSADAIIEQLRGKPAEEGVIDKGATRALRPGAAAAVATQPAPPASISMQIQFAFNSSRIEGGSLQTMENLAAALASPQLADRSFTIVGHTDGVGSAAYNQRLSQQRANSVRSFLSARGVDASRLKTEGKGFSNLLNPGNPAADENRRVEIVASSN